MGGAEVPLAVLLKPLHSQMSSVGLCAVMLQDNICLPWTFVTKPKIQLLEHMKAMSSINGFTLWQKLIKYELFSIPKDSSRGLKGSGHCFWLLFFGSVVHQSHTQGWLSSTGGKNANYKMGEVHSVEKE